MLGVIEAVSNRPRSERTILFLDEIQAAPSAFAALRYFFDGGAAALHGGGPGRPDVTGAGNRWSGSRKTCAVLERWSGSSATGRFSDGGWHDKTHNSYYGLMKEIAAREAKNRFGQLLDAAQTAPVRVTKKGRPVGVVMSMQQYERLRGAAWARLTETMDRLGAEAASRGLTEAELDVLLSDDS